MKPTLEVPVDSIAGAIMAAPFADRLELCDDLSSEGWTPTMELVREARAATGASLVVMIRPRLQGAITAMTVAGFTATPQIVDASIREIELAAAAGAHSVAIGLLTADGFVDMEACGKLADVARTAGLEVAFLRTFDLLTDRRRGMRDISTLCMKRVVTAGVLGWDASVATLEQRIAVLAEDARNAENCPFLTSALSKSFPEEAYALRMRATSCKSRRICMRPVVVAEESTATNLKN